MLSFGESGMADDDERKEIPSNGCNNHSVFYMVKFITWMILPFQSQGLCTNVFEDEPYLTLRVLLLHSDKYFLLLL